MNLKILSQNCWAIPYVSKFRSLRIEAIADELISDNYDIVGLVEIWSFKDYIFLKNAVELLLPFSHYFFSGIFGSGICVFSKFPILNTLSYNYTLNGKFHKVFHGDWFGGKCATLSHIQLPTNQLIYFYQTHTIAKYVIEDFDLDQSNCSKDIYAVDRLCQIIELTNFINMTKTDNHLMILAGDLNFQPSELPYKLLNYLTNFKDPVFTSKRAEPTYNHPSNTFKTHCNKMTYLKASHKSAISQGERLDYIFYHVENDKGIALELLNYKLLSSQVKTACQTYFGSDDKYVSLSDHEGVILELALKDDTKFNQPNSLFTLTSTRKTATKPDDLDRLLKVTDDILKSALTRTYHTQARCNRLALICMCLLITLLTIILVDDGGGANAITIIEKFCRYFTADFRVLSVSSKYMIRIICLMILPYILFSTILWALVTSQIFNRIKINGLNNARKTLRYQHSKVPITPPSFNNVIY